MDNGDIMIELLLETGIRRGELLKFYTTDINKLMGTLGANSSIDGLSEDHERSH